MLKIEFLAEKSIKSCVARSKRLGKRKSEVVLESAGKEVVVVVVVYL